MPRQRRQNGALSADAVEEVPMVDTDNELGGRTAITGRTATDVSAVNDVGGDSLFTLATVVDLLFLRQ